MKEHDPNLSMPHTRSMSEGLFELRLKGKEGIARVFCCTVVKQEILMLHTFIKKQQDAPLLELRIGRERLKEVLKNGKKKTHEQLMKIALSMPGVKREYDALENEFALLKEMVGV